MKKIELLIVIAVAALVTLFYYVPFLDNYFVWDDFIMLENYYTRNFKDFLFGFADLRVFGNCILWINCLVSGFNPIGYSLIGIGAHIANSAMLFLLIQSISNNRLLAIFTAIIFAASSVGCDAIFWKCAFLTVTGLFFYLLILYLYVEGNKRGRWAYHNLALIVFILAMFNKEEIASIPFMIIFIEMLFFKDRERLTLKLKRVLPYFVVIVIYILLSFVISRYYVSQEQFEIFLSFRPLHTLFSGFASFFISPEGHLSWKDPFIYITALLLLACLILIKDRRFLLFGIGWIFLTFLPQSLTGLTMYDVKYLFNSISRHLYISSVGPAMIFALLLLNIRDKVRTNYFISVSCLFFLIFIFINYSRVHDRGNEWRRYGKVMKRFLSSLKQVQPQFPKNSYLYVEEGPTGNAYMQRALRSFYKNPDMYWIDESTSTTLRDGDSFFLILHNWGPGDAVKVFKLK